MMGRKEHLKTARTAAWVNQKFLFTVGTSVVFSTTQPCLAFNCGKLMHKQYVLVTKKSGLKQPHGKLPLQALSHLHSEEYAQRASD